MIYWKCAENARTICRPTLQIITIIDTFGIIRTDLSLYKTDAIHIFSFSYDCLSCFWRRKHPQPWIDAPHIPLNGINGANCMFWKLMQAVSQNLQRNERPVSFEDPGLSGKLSSYDPCLIWTSWLQCFLIRFSLIKSGLIPLLMRQNGHQGSRVDLIII